MFWQKLKVYERIALLRWVLPPAIFIFVVLYQTVLFRWIHDQIGFFQHSAVEIFVYGVIGPLVVYLALTWVAHGLRQKDRAEAKVHERDQFLASITASSEEAILSLDQIFHVQFWNHGARAMLGYASEQMMGQPLGKLFPMISQDDLEDVQGLIQKQGFLLDYETTLVHHNGQHVPVEVTVSALYNDHAQLQGYSVIIHDITQRKRRERMLNEERKRIAGDIHDSFAQDLYSVQLKLDVCQKLSENGQHEQMQNELELMRSVLKKSIRDVRRTIFTLRPIEFEKSTLQDAIKHISGQYQQLYGLEIEVNFQPIDIAFPKRAQLVLLRILQESLNNVVKHSHARRCDIHLEVKEDNICLSVSDDGQGFLADLVDSKLHFGLLNMREQVERQGGCFMIDTKLGEGTQINVCLPYNPLGRS